jgi:phosphoribosylanthranilate isomerase
MAVRVKICGLKTPETVKAAVDAGAAYVGFNFFGPSPRFLSPGDAGALAIEVPPGIAKVAVTVDLDDAALDAITGAVPLDMIQLHGTETPERVAAVRHRYGLPVIKMLGLGGPEDAALIDAFGQVANQLLVEAKAPKGAVLPGGNGVAFDWRLIAGRRWPVPWMLAGGLTPENLAEAVRLTGARQVDVSSGVESAPGVKDPARIAAFLRAAAGT